MLIEKQKEIFYKYFSNKKIPLDKEVTCGICLKVIKDKYLSCPECNKFIHKECIDLWLDKKQNCVYCRSDVWENYCYFEKKKQLNLFDNI